MNSTQSTYFIAEANIDLAASRSIIWDALTNPAIIKQYFFGTEADSDWQLGKTITFRGEWDGKPYKDKGVILEITPEYCVKYNYWSSMSDKDDKAEHYRAVSYEIKESESKSGCHTLSITQECDTAAQRDDSSNNWAYILKSLQTLLES